MQSISKRITCIFPNFSILLINSNSQRLLIPSLLVLCFSVKADGSGIVPETFLKSFKNSPQNSDQNYNWNQPKDISTDTISLTFLYGKTSWHWNSPRTFLKSFKNSHQNSDQNYNWNRPKRHHYWYHLACFASR